MKITLTPYGRATVSRVLAPGWNRLDTDIGAYTERGLDAVQFRCARGGWYTARVEFDDGTVWGPFEGYLQPRAILTVRRDSPLPTHGLLRLVGDKSDFSGGGGFGIDACGSVGTVHDHDAAMQRHNVGLYSMETGKLLAPAEIPREAYYTGPHGYPYGKTTQLAAYCVKWDPSNIYDDRRDAADATAIPSYGVELRATVLAFCAFDYQHLVRYFRFALYLLNTLGAASLCPLVKADLRAALRDCEIAWDSAREANILASAGGFGHADVGREFAWVSYLAAIVERFENPIGRTLGNLIGYSLTARMRRIAKHVAHSQTGILQRFVEGMSGSPYPYGPYPNSGVEEGRGIALTQHLESCAQIVALDALGLKGHALKLCQTILTYPGLKWWNTDTGHPEGGSWHGPAEDQAWAPLAVYLRLDWRAGLQAITRHKIPTYLGGSWVGPFPTVPMVLVALKNSSETGKTRNAIAEIEAGMAAASKAAA